MVPSLFECAFKPAIKPTSSLPLPEKDEASLGALPGLAGWGTPFRKLA